VWLVDTLGGTLIRVDPRTLALTRQSLTGDPIGVAAGGGAVWVTDKANGVVNRIPIRGSAGIESVPVGPQPYQVAFGEGFAWVVGAHGTLTKVDPVGVSSVWTVNLRPSVQARADSNYAAEVIAGPEGVWVTLTTGTGR
jgi:streptogramin lyase